MKQKSTRHGSAFRGFLLGVMVTVLVLGCVLPAAAASAGELQTLSALVGGISIYVDKVLMIPKDVTGKVVEPMVIDGTTYVPVRAVASALGKEVGWDQETRSVYIGGQPEQDEVSVPAESLSRYTGYSAVATGAGAKYQILGDWITPSNAVLSYDYAGNGSRTNLITWKLDAGYKYIDGKFVMSYGNLGDTAAYTLSFYKVDERGTETLLNAVTAKCADGPVAVHVDVSSCNFVRVKCTPVKESSTVAAVFYDITATKAG